MIVKCDLQTKRATLRECRATVNEIGSWHEAVTAWGAFISPKESRWKHEMKIWYNIKHVEELSSNLLYKYTGPRRKEHIDLMYI